MGKSVTLVWLRGLKPVILLCQVKGRSSLNYKRLETFVWVASLGSFRKAAERMHTTQPAISARISALESELGEFVQSGDIFCDVGDCCAYALFGIILSLV